MLKFCLSKAIASSHRQQTCTYGCTPAGHCVVYLSRGMVLGGEERRWCSSTPLNIPLSLGKTRCLGSFYDLASSLRLIWETLDSSPFSLNRKRRYPPCCKHPAERYSPLPSSTYPPSTKKPFVISSWVTTVPSWKPSTAWPSLATAKGSPGATPCPPGAMANTSAS